MAISWTPDLAVGDPAIDGQHQEIFRRTDALLEAMRQGKGKAEVARLLEFLGEYVQRHFAQEARAMAEAGYPRMEAHLAEHDSFVKDYLSIKAAHDAGGATTALVIEVNNRVCNWLRTHIPRTDKAMAGWLDTQRTAK